MGVSKNRGGPPKWMVYCMENPIKMDDLGVHLFLETPKWHPCLWKSRLDAIFQLGNFWMDLSKQKDVHCLGLVSIS